MPFRVLLYVCARLGLTCGLLIVGNAHAALPPYAQKLHDLEDLTKYIEANKGVSARLEHIDLVNFVLRLRGGCEVFFERQVIPRPPGWVGPASPLVFKRASCEIPPY